MTARMFGQAAVAAVAVATVAPAIAAGPLTIASRMMVERRTAAADGSTRSTLVPAVRAVPGDRIAVVLAYRNTGTVPVRDLVLANPVPRNVAYRGAAAEGAAPEVSVDGKTFASLSALRVTMPDGSVRPAVADDVTHVRWRLTDPVRPGAAGELAFRAVLK